jgi:hypothetical protein
MKHNRDLTGDSLAHGLAHTSSFFDGHLPSFACTTADKKTIGSGIYQRPDQWWHVVDYQRQMVIKRRA